MSAGKYDKRITIQQKSVTRDTYGGETVAWVDVATVWAKEVATGGREFYSAQQLHAEMDHLFEIRYRTGITTTMRISWDSRYFDILAAPPTPGRKRDVQLVCKEVV